MYTLGSRRRRTSPRRVLLLLILIGAGVFVIINQNQLRQQLVPPPTPTATRTARSYVVEAESLYEAGNVPATIDAYVQAVSLDPQNVDVLIKLSRLLVLRGRTVEGVRYAERAAQAAPKNVPAQAALAMAYDWHGSRLQQRGRELEAGDFFQKAIAAGKTAVTLDGTYAEAHAYLAETYADLSSWESATDRAQQALDLDANRADVQRALAYVRESQGNYSGAVEAYERAIQLAPREVNLYVALGQDYRVLTDWPKAIDAFERATKIDPAYVAGFDDLGWTHYLIEDFKQAERILEQAIKIDPTAWSPRSHLAATYFVRKNYEDAATTFKTAIELMNTDFDADRYCVVAKTRACDRVVVAYATMAVSNCYLAEAYNDPSKYEQVALPAFRRALTIRPDDEGVLSNMDFCQRVMGKPPFRTPTPQPFK
ncbi:MAG TPA: tetratricopeptide repeat protein [Anaerolineae bacterium]|nr:tetratricopeptide repeat protein [Anaerolineae bacterium]